MSYAAVTVQRWDSSDAGWGLPPRMRWRCGCLSGARGLELAGDVPDEARELARNGDADLVHRELASREMPVALGEAQLCLPRDLAHDLSACEIST